jgi:colanic acid biosynthesis glycosyl transferase WcaI
MKILIYGLNYAPEPTGTGKYTGEMAEWFAAHGHDVEVICGLPHYPRWKLDDAYRDGRSRVESRAGVLVQRASHYVPGPDGLTARARIRLETGFTLSAARYWLPRFFSRGKPDVVIAVSPPLQTGMWPLFFCWVRRVPWVLHVQDLQVDAALRLNMLKVGGGGRLLYWVEGFLLRHATRVSTITEAMRARVVAKGTPAERVLLFPNWSDISKIEPGPRNNAFRRELGFDEQTIVALYAGNMGEKQGLELILEAAGRCRDDPRLQFVLAGDGAARARLERVASAAHLGNVRFLPVQPLERFGEMLALGDIHLVVQKRVAADLVMPSKLTNILAAGRACVATADPGTALYEVVVGHGTGIAVEPEDAKTLASAILKMASDAGSRESCGRNAREYAEKHLDQNRILAAFESDLEKICAQRGGGQ